MAARLGKLRLLLAPVAVVLALAMALPPVASEAGRTAVVQALQIVVYAAVVPALLTLGGPAVLARVGRRVRTRGATAAAVAMTLLPYLGSVVVWRVPAVAVAQAHSAALTVVEMITLVASGCIVWATLTGALPAPRPLRAAMAAVAMWTIWVIAYIAGMSVTGLTHAQPGADSQQLAVAVMWAVPAVCYVPVIYLMIVRWLSEREEPADAGRTLDNPAWPDLAGPLRPPRGWRPPAS